MEKRLSHIADDLLEKRWLQLHEEISNRIKNASTLEELEVIMREVKVIYDECYLDGQTCIMFGIKVIRRARAIEK